MHAVQRVEAVLRDGNRARHDVDMQGAGMERALSVVCRAARRAARRQLGDELRFVTNRRVVEPPRAIHTAREPSAVLITGENASAFSGATALCISISARRVARRARKSYTSRLLAL